MGSAVEPRWMGKGLNLSPLVVFVSLVLWGWVLGPVGMLLSIPLTIMVKISLATSDDSRWISILLGDSKAMTSIKY
jgi:predicted PurR-regulated permease PerM